MKIILNLVECFGQNIFIFEIIFYFGNPISMAVDCIKWHELSKPPIPYLNEPYNVKAKRSKAVAVGYLFKPTR